MILGLEEWVYIVYVLEEGELGSIWVSGEDFCQEPLFIEMKKKLNTQKKQFHVVSKTKKFLTHWICLSLWNRSLSLLVTKETDLLLYMSHKIYHREVK